MPILLVKKLGFCKIMVLPRDHRWPGQCSSWFAGVGWNVWGDMGHFENAQIGSSEV
jgi:hypothetical protein